jgi:hypothetical protein
MNKKNALASALGIALLGTGSAYAANIGVLPGYAPITSASSNLTVLTLNGVGVGGTNNVVINWDGTAFNANSDYTGLGSVSNMTAASATPFSGDFWTAHDIQVFAPGSYAFDTTLGGGIAESGMLNMQVGAGQLGMHMLFDWGAGTNMDFAVLWQNNAVFGSNYTSCVSSPGSNCLWNSGPASSFAGGTTANRPAGNQVWMLASIDGDGDGVPGIRNAAGATFSAYTFNFNVQPVPLPPAAVLFGSGLLGLLGMARKRKPASGGPGSDPRESMKQDERYR